MDKFIPRGEGPTVESDLPPTPHILLKKTTQQNHIVVGDDRAQIRFLEQRLGSPARTVERVTDDMLAGFTGLLFHVPMKHKIDISPEIRSRTGIWSADPIVKGSAAINTLVKFAATFLPGGDKPLKRDVVDRVGDELTKGKIEDIRGVIWKAVWILSDGLGQKELWKDPWESPTAWLTLDMNVDQRLHSLYRKLVGYASLVVHGEDAAANFKQLSLDPAKVYRSIELLSRWRQGRMPAYICALQITTIWS
jgi:hypothetical protein